MWPVCVMAKVFAQASNQVPHPGHEQRHENGATDHAERLPQRRLDHGDEKRRKKKRHRRKDGPLASNTLAPIILENLIYDAVPTRLHLARTLRVRILRMQD